MSDRESGHTGGCDAVEGGYSIFIDGGTIASFMEAGDYSSARELRHFGDIAAAVGARSTGEAGVSLMALSVTPDRLARDFAVVNVAHVLAKQGKRVLIVDCDFLAPGLGGLVENVDDLGFLDLLLYGSSLKTVVRPTGIDGVGVTAPGSFPVTKTVPFAQKEFAKVAAHLARSSDVVIYCSTLYTDEGIVNPLASLVDGLLLCCRIDEMEEGQLRRSLGDLESGLPPADLVCFCAPGGAAAATAATDAGAGGEPAGVTPPAATGEEPPRPIEVPPADEEPGGPFPVGAPAGAEDGETPGGVNLPRIVTVAVVVIVVGFLAWWIAIDRTAPDGDLPPVVAESAETPAAAGDGTPVAADGETSPAPGGERTADAPDEPGDAGPGEEGKTPSDRGGVETADGGTDTGETPSNAGDRPDAAPTAAKTVADGRWVVHVSSFRDEARVEREIAYLEENGFEARAVEVDIRGERWIRVVVGAYATVEDANEAKLELLSLRRIANARVIRRPE